jgi:hypothetical protein
VNLTKKGVNLNFPISKIKFEIDINNDELLGIVWEHKREILKVRVQGALLSLEHIYGFTF